MRLKLRAGTTGEVVGQLGADQGRGPAARCAGAARHQGRADPRDRRARAEPRRWRRRGSREEDEARQKKKKTTTRKRRGARARRRAAPRARKRRRGAKKKKPTKREEETRPREEVDEARTRKKSRRSAKKATSDEEEGLRRRRKKRPRRRRRPATKRGRADEEERRQEAARRKEDEDARRTTGSRTSRGPQSRPTRRSQRVTEPARGRCGRRPVVHARATWRSPTSRRSRQGTAGLQAGGAGRRRAGRFHRLPAGVRPQDEGHLTRHRSQRALRPACS